MHPLWKPVFKKAFSWEVLPIWDGYQPISLTFIHYFFSIQLRRSGAFFELEKACFHQEEWPPTTSGIFVYFSWLMPETLGIHLPLWLSLFYF